MSKLSFDQMLDAGVHFGHLKRKWNPSMAPYIFEEKKVSIDRFKMESCELVRDVH